MGYIKVKMKDGTTRSGEVWLWRPREGWFSLIGQVEDPIRLEDLESATDTDRVGILRDEKGGAIGPDIQTRDLLDRARKDGWEPPNA